MRLRGRALRLLLVGLLALPLTASFVPQADAQDDPIVVDPAAGVAGVLQVSGLLDPILADFITEGIVDAEAEGVRVIMLQVNSTGSVLSDAELNDLAQVIFDAGIPITMWVGPSGSRAQGAWVELAALMDRIGIAPGSRFGKAGDELRLDSRFGSAWGAASATLANDTVGHNEALELGIASFPAPVVGDFLVGLSDLGIETEAVGDSTQLTTVVRFERLSLVAQQLHTVASPPVAYLLFTLGLALLVFEFYTAGVGVAGVVGAVMFLLGSFGLWVLPISTIAVALLLISMFAFSIDVQTGVPRFWTIFGAVVLAIGTITLFRDGASMSWIPMSVGIVGITMMMVTGMPTMVRTRFSTPTIGREWMIGTVGDAVEAVDPDGVVKIHDALWRARTNRATPLAEGSAVRVVSVEGLVLEVEPEDGGARDYRERRSDAGES